jgi:hypothetical protein
MAKLGLGSMVIVALAGACSSATPGGGVPDGDVGPGPQIDGGGDAIDASPGTPDAAPPPGTPDAAPHPGGPTVLYVATTGQDFYTGTDPTQPMQHLALAIERATHCTPAPCEVRLAAGEYHEVITLASGVALTGGYSIDFQTRDVPAFPTVISNDEVRTVIANGLDATTRLYGLTIRGADYSHRIEGESTYALWVRDSGSFLELDQTTIIGGKGGRGVAGADGTLMTCNARGGPGGTASDCSSQGGAVGDAGGDPTAGGGGAGGGSSNCPNACPLVGSDGVSGGGLADNGANGADGANGTPATDTDGDFVNDLWVGTLGLAGARGLHGTGGGGGGSGGTKRFRACFGCGTLLGGRGGDGAPGGCGGTGGTSGGPGGASFALVIIRSDVRLGTVSIRGGAAGDGGVGGDGHAGAPGGTDGSVGRGGEGSQTCGLIHYHSGPGGTGGVGGHGGQGGGGPGGTGGASVGIALVGGGSVVEGEPGGLELIAGTPGGGGVGGTGSQLAPSGAVGALATTITY